MKLINEKPNYSEWVKVYTEKGKIFIIKLQRGGILQTHHGSLSHSDIIEAGYGKMVRFSSGSHAHILRPGIDDNSMKIKRLTQIVYPKDIGFILLKLDIKEGDYVLEAGLGSASMCGALSRYVGESGKVYTYEKREEFLKTSMSNLNKWNLLNRVVFHLQDVGEGFKESDYDAAFIDLPYPVPQLKYVREKLKFSGRLCVLCPTVNQCSQVIHEMNDLGFTQVEMWESIFRPFKTNPDRIRPVDMIYAHTAYLIFGQKISKETEEN